MDSACTPIARQAAAMTSRTGTMGGTTAANPRCTFRRATRADAESLAALSIEVWLHTYATNGVSAIIARHVLREFTSDNFVARLENQRIAILVAEASDGLAGYAELHFDATCPASDSSRVELGTLYVRAHFARVGIGSELLARAEALAVAGWRCPLWLAVYAGNPHAIAFYANRGYARIGHAWFDLGGTKHENHLLLGG